MKAGHSRQSTNPTLAKGRASLRMLSMILIFISPSGWIDVIHSLSLSQQKVGKFWLDAESAVLSSGVWTPAYAGSTAWPRVHHAVTATVACRI